MFCLTIPCSLVSGYVQVRKIYCFYIQVHFIPEDDSSRFLQSVGNHIGNCSVAMQKDHSFTLTVFVR